MTRERWSVRKFAPEQIRDEEMARILEGGRANAHGLPGGKAAGSETASSQAVYNMQKMAMARPPERAGDPYHD